MTRSGNFIQRALGILALLVGPSLFLAALVAVILEKFPELEGWTANGIVEILGWLAALAIVIWITAYLTRPLVAYLEKKLGTFGQVIGNLAAVGLAIGAIYLLALTGNWLVALVLSAAAACAGRLVIRNLSKANKGKDVQA